MDMINNQKLL